MKNASSKGVTSFYKRTMERRHQMSEHGCQTTGGLPVTHWQSGLNYLGTSRVRPLSNNVIKAIRLGGGETEGVVHCLKP